MQLELDDRIATLRAHGAGEAEVAELLAYGANAFDVSAADGLTYPLADEPFVEIWREYESEAREVGVAACLRRHLPQLRFPIAAGMSEHPDYRAATRRGILPDRGGGVEFAEPERLRLFVHPTPAGSVAVIVAGARVDFERLVQALTRRNEPDVIPASMGACIVAGYNNWERVQRLRGEWESNNPGVCDGAAWANEFQRIVPRKALYQDRFIVLSSGPYSATPWEATGLSEAEWTDASVTIRLEHECAHYFTKRVLGSMQNSLVDELIADYCGLVTATGRVRGEWLLHFMGLEAYPVYREGGRLQNYRGKPPLTDRAFAVLQSMFVQAAKNLERFDAARCEFQNWQSLSHRAQTIVALAGAGLERLASNANPFTMATVKRQHSPLDRTRANDKMGQRLSNVLVPIRNL